MLNISSIINIQESFDKYVTKQRLSVSFPNIKNMKYTFCRKFNSE